MKEVEKLQAALREMSEKHKQASVTGACVKCGLLALPRCFTPLGVREYRISGLCEICFDDTFADPEDEHV
jgi:hypothetical protein